MQPTASTELEMHRESLPLNGEGAMWSLALQGVLSFKCATHCVLRWKRRGSILLDCPTGSDCGSVIEHRREDCAIVRVISAAAVGAWVLCRACCASMNEAAKDCITALRPIGEQDGAG